MVNKNIMDHKNKIPISINCVCKNEAFILESAIDSVASYVEEILFVDHYSFDNTLDIAKQLEQRYTNFKILEKNPDIIMNYTDVRELARSMSKCNYVMKYDGDFILTDYKLLEQYVNILKSSETTIGISFSVNDLFRDIKHIIHRNGYEPYIFKKSAIHFYNNGEYPDAYEIIHKGTILNEKTSPVIHINNVKPALNILFRARMTEYHIQNHFKGNYFEWLYFINNNRLPNREEFVHAMINYLRNECTHRLDSDKSKISKNTNDINSLLHNTQISYIEIVKKKEGYYYDKTIFLQYKNILYFYPEDLTNQKLKNVLFEMYDDNVFNNFQ
jgi:hypothetical protein